VSTRIRLNDVRRAWESRDPELTGLVADLAGQPDETPEPPPREGALTINSVLAEIRNPAFRRKPIEEQARLRVERFQALESPTAEVPLPDRLRLYEVVSALWEDNGPYARASLLELIRQVPLRYGPWKALKRIFKEAEARDETQIFGALAARIDAVRPGEASDVSDRTLDYLRRRAWRYLRRLARLCPASYADVAADVLANYEDQTPWPSTWVANQVLYREAGQYTRSTFRYKRRTKAWSDQAFPELWKRSPRPLFGLLERARSDLVRQFAAEGLKADFRASIREVEPGWVARLVFVQSRPVDDFVVWVLKNVPRFEQSAFRELGLHDAVLHLFDSPSREAGAYAAEYARTFARDLPVDQLVGLADNGNPAVYKLALDLLQARDPRKEVGLDAWGRLLLSIHGRALAASVLRKSFGASELTPEWFRDRLFTDNTEAFVFVKTLLFETHRVEALGPGFFLGLIEAADEPEREMISALYAFATDHLAKFDLDALDVNALRRLLLRPWTTSTTRSWVDQGRLKAQSFGLDFLKALAFHSDWETDPWVATLRSSRPAWARGLAFDEPLADKVISWLGDVRRFAPSDLGFTWLLRLAARGEPRYHDFAAETMIKGFSPADFAGQGGETAEAAPATVDFAGASFLFTGKLATMKREEAEQKVRQAGGSVASGVTAKLHYLVIGDEGSPLYGHGKKGSKQEKADELNAAGANIKVISETAFLRMLTGRVRTASAGDALAGAERLWEMANAPGPADAPLARFAVRYLRRHHPDIALAETDRPVDPGAEVPAEFLTLERVKPLFWESRKPLRDLALELARWEFARWGPSQDDLVALAECPHADVRRFVAEALLADGAPEHRRYRIDPEALGPAAVFRFCESADDSSRALGIRLIGRSPKFQLPEELFRLTESPDRRVRAFVVRTLWSLYRDRGITAGWRPVAPPSTTVGAAAKKAAAAKVVEQGTGPPARPDDPPAPPRDLWALLRRSLFELPPARPEKSRDDEGATERLRPLPARKAKLALIETVRDLALEDLDFARGVLPLLEEFLVSRGPSERGACLVAVTRIRHEHPSLHRAGTGVTP
jgi:hypothetical protein